MGRRADRRRGALLERVLPRGQVGRFQLQAAIAAVHAEAPTWEATDWPQIVVLYEMLERVAPSPAVHAQPGRRRRHGARARARARPLDPLLDDPVMQRHHRTHAVRAHLLEMAGDRRRQRRGSTRGPPG